MIFHSQNTSLNHISKVQISEVLNTPFWIVRYRLQKQTYLLCQVFVIIDRLCPSFPEQKSQRLRECLGNAAQFKKIYGVLLDEVKLQ